MIQTLWSPLKQAKAMGNKGAAISLSVQIIAPFDNAAN
jgi:hypothetical protein